MWGVYQGLLGGEGWGGSVMRELLFMRIELALGSRGGVFLKSDQARLSLSFRLICGFPLSPQAILSPTNFRSDGCR